MCRSCRVDRQKEGGGLGKRLSFFVGVVTRCKGEELNSLTKGVEREHDRSAESYVVSSR